MLSEETGRNTLSSIGSDVDEPADAGEHSHDDDGDVPPSDIADVFVGIDMSEEVTEGNQEH